MGRDMPGESIVGILLSDSIWRFDSIRNSADNWLTRIGDRLLQRALPQLQEGVRGNVIAADSLLQALIRCANSTCFDIYVQPWSEASARARFGCEQPESRKCRVHSMADLVESEIGPFSAWLNPLPVHDAIEISQRIRVKSKRVYPIAFLTHGLGLQGLFYDYFLRVQLEGTYPCDSFVCTSRASLEAARKIVRRVREDFNRDFGAAVSYNGRFDLIPLCVDTDKFCPRDKRKARSILRLPQEAFTILFLGRLSFTKADLNPFVETFRLLVERNPDRGLLWVIAGTEDTGYAKVVLDACRGQGIDKRVRVILNVSDDTKRLLLSAADVFISPTDSVQESFGLCPIEAMACGIPQVVPDWDGYRDTVVHGKTGFLLPTYWAECDRDLSDTGWIGGGVFDLHCLGQSIAVDGSKFLDSIQTLIDNRQLRRDMAQSSRERALSLYSYASVAKQYEELWLELENIASKVEGRSMPNRFGRSHYYGYFEHYASDLLGDETELRLVGRGRTIIGGARYLPPDYTILSSFKVLDERILDEALRYMTDGKGPRGSEDNRCRQVQMGELVSWLGKMDDRRQTDRIRRHVLWLIKYGLLEPITEKQDRDLTKVAV